MPDHRLCIDSDERQHIQLKKTTVACHRSTIIFGLKFKSVVENVTIHREKSQSVAEIAKIVHVTHCY